MFGPDVMRILVSLATVFFVLTTNVVSTYGQFLGDQFTTDAEIARALEEAGANREELQNALDSVNDEQRIGMRFLIANMPARDLAELKADFLISNVEHAYETFAKTPWRDQIPVEVFLNDVLPYASVNERRDAWRQTFHEQFRDLISDAQSPGQAAAILNQKIFPMLNVRYSTKRKKADQSPFETIDSGLASCTGLSILLVDACRSVGIPARFVGTPLWSDKSGNHSWVEVYDDGWHFTGAAEPAGDVLDRAWFTGRAAGAKKDDPDHAIYATSFKRTPIHFPLVWNPDARYISAINVTQRYLAAIEPVGPNGARVRFRALESNKGERIIGEVDVRNEDGLVVATGKTNDERFDANDHWTAELQRGQNYRVTITANGQEHAKILPKVFHEQLVTLVTSDGTWEVSPRPANCQIVDLSDDDYAWLQSDAAKTLQTALRELFQQPADQRDLTLLPSTWDAEIPDHESAIRQMVWDAYRESPEAKSLREDWEDKKVTWRDYVSPYTVKQVGEKPESGWPVFIAMHGGGGVPPEVNDQQWSVMQRYYRDQDDLPGYLYIALRAPTNEWNGFYTTYNLGLMQELIKQLAVSAEVDTNRVYLMGYSHGGYGAFYVGRQMADRFAAVHASASAPSIGNQVGKNLRNTRFTFMFGEKDTRYGRLERCQAFADFMKQLKEKEQDAEAYPVVAEYKADHGHTGLPDRDKIADMYPHARNPIPKRLTLLTTSDLLTSFSWLRINPYANNVTIDARVDGNKLILSATQNVSLEVLLDGRMVDWDEPVTIEQNESTAVVQLQPSVGSLCESLLERGDPKLMFAAKLKVDVPSEQ